MVSAAPEWVLRGDGPGLHNAELQSDKHKVSFQVANFDLGEEEFVQRYRQPCREPVLQADRSRECRSSRETEHDRHGTPHTLLDLSGSCLPCADGATCARFDAKTLRLAIVLLINCTSIASHPGTSCWDLLKQPS